MRKALSLLTCLIGISLLAGCTIAEPSYRPDLGGYAMIDDEKEKTVVSRGSLQEDTQLSGKTHT